MLARSKYGKKYHRVKSIGNRYVLTLCKRKLRRSTTQTSIWTNSISFSKAEPCKKCFPNAFKTIKKKTRAETIKKFNLPHLKTKQYKNKDISDA